MCSFDAALKAAGSLDVILFPYELAEGMDYTRKVIEEIQPGQSVGIFIGLRAALSGKRKRRRWRPEPG